MEYNITYRQKDKGWQVIISYKTPNGVWKQKSRQGFPNTRDGKKLAKIEADKMLQELKTKSNFIADKTIKDITFLEFTKLYIAHLKIHLSYKTIEGYNCAIKGFESIHDIKVKDVTSLQIQNNVDKLISSGLKQSTIKKYLTNIKVIFNAAVVKYKIMQTTPVSEITIKIEKSKPVKNALTVGELDLLLSKIRNRQYFIICLIAGKCGLRIGEIIGLTWDCVDLDKKIIIVNKQWKKDANGVFKFGELKTKNSYREVDFSDEVKRELIKYKNEKVKSIDNRLIIKDNTNAIGINLKRSLKTLGYDMSIHEFRHTYATNLIANGLDYKTTAELMGQDVKETMATYSHVTSDMRKKAISIINSI